MARVLILLSLLGGIWLLVKAMARVRRRKATKEATVAGIREGIPMVRCAHCGVYLPAPDAVSYEGEQIYCSLKHRDAGHDAHTR